MPTRHLAVFALLLLLPLLACGKKGAVRPLLKPLPAAVQSEASQVGAALRLTLQLPNKNQDGSLLKDLAAVRIYRRENPGGPCAECDDPSELWREIDPEYPVNARRNGNRLTLDDVGVLPGHGYRYLVEPVTRSGLSGEATRLGRVALPPLPGPVALTAAGLDRMVRLAWNPATLPEGWSLVGYTIYRAAGDDSFGDLPLNSQPVGGLRYEDVGPQNHTDYRYQVRCLAKRGDATVESEGSNVASAVPHPEE